ncbi:hypothetical protein ASD65_00215 [Microbacterium sp. Root61]|uniref:FUSC family protein n=1 Tax=Microbacterium sp. Root61 TaxID=1736570 RepID=UPI00072652D8|nr:FUSC family protein [Microbacterium sp. Root61]KRA23018.1 hypothetical protein ASD65_00215 [Microbacterium sp. Root61]
MDAVWVGLGIAVLGLTLLDVFLTALNYDEAGFFAGRLASWQWSLIRQITRRLSRRWRPVVLRQVTGLQIMVTVLAWIGGVILGFGLIYLGLMQGKSFLYDGVHADLFGAIYFSAAQLATVGTSQLTPNTDVLRVLSIAETLTGVVLVSLILTFLLGIYDVISSLRSLSSQFFSAGRGVGEPIASLKPYFPEGRSRGLDGHLDSISDSFGSYTDGVRLHHAAYYFQSGRDTFSLPYSVRMLSGVIAGLRWGLPASNPVTQEPTLLPLTEQFDKFQAYMHPLLNWKSTDVPEALSRADFDRLIEADRKLHGSMNRRRAAKLADAGDPWVTRFAGVNRDMGELVQEAPFVDLEEAYARYLQWLPFAYHARQFTIAVSKDLDYQPVYSNGTDQVEDAVLIPPSPKKLPSRIRSFFHRRMTLIDPGLSRAIDALRVLGAAIFTVVVVVGVGFAATGSAPMQIAIFGGMITMFAASAAGAGRGRSGWGRFAGVVVIIPVLAAIGLDAIVPAGPLISAIVLVLLAFVGMILAGFGPMWGGFGQLAFVTFYFILLLRLSPREWLLYALTATLSVIVAVLIQAIPNRNAHARVVVGGVNALELRIARVMDPLIDTVSAARWDPDLRRRVHAELKQLHHAASFLSGQLVEPDSELGLTPGQLDALRMRVFDVELAVVNLATAARSATGLRVPVPIRALLAGELEHVQKHVREYPERPTWATSGDDSSAAVHPALAFRDPPVDWPPQARQVHRALYELVTATDALHTAGSAELGSNVTATDDQEEPADATAAWGAPPAADATSEGTASPTDATEDPASEGEAETDAAAAAGPAGATSPTSDADASPFAAPLRRAVQAALSTGLALWVGSLISTSYQYWAVMPAHQVLGETDGETYRKGTQRILATVAGATVGFGLAITVGSNPAVLLPALALTFFASTYFRAVSAPLSTFWQTMMFAMLYEYLGKLDTETIELRILETVVGAVIALVVAALILPTRTRTRLNTDTMRLVRTVKDVTERCLQRLSNDPAAAGFDRKSFAHEELQMTAQLRRVQATAAPLRRASGALDVHGIEGQLTALWALLLYTRHLIAATDALAPAENTLTADEWDQVRTVCEDDFDVLLTVLDGRLPAALQEDIPLADRDDSGDSRTLEAVLSSIARIDQTLAVMIDNAQPDTGRFARIRSALASK